MFVFSITGIVLIIQNIGACGYDFRSMQSLIIWNCACKLCKITKPLALTATTFSEANKVPNCGRCLGCAPRWAMIIYDRLLKLLDLNLFTSDMTSRICSYDTIPTLNLSGRTRLLHVDYDTAMKSSPATSNLDKYCRKIDKLAVDHLNNCLVWQQAVVKLRVFITNKSLSPDRIWHNTLKIYCYSRTKLELAFYRGLLPAFHQRCK